MTKKGEIRKLSFVPRTLDDEIVRDGLQAVSLLNDTEPYYLVGGIATQSYLPTSCRRPTSDVDFSIVRPLNYEDFKKMASVVREWLQDHSYSTETKRRSRAFAIDYTNSSGETLCLEFSKRNQHNFEQNKNRLEREFDNANSKILEERQATYRVTRAEDIAVPKLTRTIHALRRSPSLKKYLVGDIEALTDEKIYKQLHKIEEMREEAMMSVTDHELAEQLRFISDLYDIRVLSELAGFNKKYLETAENEWGIFMEPVQERERIMRMTIPNTLIGE